MKNLQRLCGPWLFFPAGIILLMLVPIYSVVTAGGING